MSKLGIYFLILPNYDLAHKVADESATDMFFSANWNLTADHFKDKRWRRIAVDDLVSFWKIFNVFNHCYLSRLDDSVTFYTFNRLTEYIMLYGAVFVRCLWLFPYYRSSLPLCLRLLLGWTVTARWLLGSVPGICRSHQSRMTAQGQQRNGGVQHVRSVRSPGTGTCSITGRS